MTLTVADIGRWDAGSVREVFHAASSRAQAAADAANGLATLPAFTSWGGVAAQAAKEAIGKTRQHLDAHGREAMAVANAARSAADEIERIKSDLATLKADTESLGMEIDAVSGKVLPGRMIRDPMEALLKKGQLQPRLDKIVAEANLVDMALANAIHMADGSVPAATDSSDQPGNLDEALREVAGAPDRGLDQYARSDKDDETRSTRSPLTAPIVDADPSVLDEQRARVESARHTLDAAQAELDAAAAQIYTQGTGLGRSDIGALSKAVFDARRELTKQTKILEDLDQAAAASGGPTVPVPALPENAQVQGLPPHPSVFAEGSRALSEGSLGLIPDVAKDVDVFTNWGQHSGTERAGAVLDAAGLVPIPGAKSVSEGIEHSLDALNAARHFDDGLDASAGAHHAPDAPPSPDATTHHSGEVGAPEASHGQHLGDGTPQTIYGPGNELLPLVPEHATGSAVANGKGMVYDLPPNTEGLDPRVTRVRVMEPTTSGPYPYPTGYAVYENGAGQAVNPVSGKTISRDDPYWHIPLE